MAMTMASQLALCIRVFASKSQKELLWQKTEAKSCAFVAFVLRLCKFHAAPSQDSALPLPNGPAQPGGPAGGPGTKRCFGAVVQWEERARLRRLRG